MSILARTSSRSTLRQDRRDVDPVDQRVQVGAGQHAVDVDPGEEAVEIQARQQPRRGRRSASSASRSTSASSASRSTVSTTLQIDPVHDGLHVDPLDDRVDVDPIDDPLDVDLVDDALDVDLLDHRLHVDPLHDAVDVDRPDHAGRDLVGDRLHHLARPLEQGVEQPVAAGPEPADPLPPLRAPTPFPADRRGGGAAAPVAASASGANVWNASPRQSTSSSGSVDGDGIEGDADVEAIAAAERRDVHRAAQPGPERVAPSIRGSADVPRPAQPGQRRGGEVDRLGLGVEAPAAARGRAGDRRRPPGRWRRAAPARDGPGTSARRRRRTVVLAGRPPSGARRACGREPVAAELVAAALAGRCDQTQLRQGPDPLVVQADAGRRGGDQQVVAAAPESDGRLPRACRPRRSRAG